jgi:hypothetical protein
MADAGRLTEAYHRIDGLLEARARDYPRRVEPTWSDLLAAVDGVAERLRARVEAPGEDGGSLLDAYDRPVFVVGHRKTGTTLLLDLLDGHPRLVALPGESNHFLTFLPRFGGLSGDRIAAEAQRWWMLRLITPSGIPPFWAAGRPWELGVDPYEVFSRRLLGLVAANGGRDTLGLAALALHEARGGPPGALSAWVEKTPGQEHEVERMLAVYPAARFVHVLRDPRSVAAAIRRLDRDTGRETDLVGVGLDVGGSFEAAGRNERRLGSGRYLVLRYEDLLADSRAMMGRVADLVGVEWSETLLTPTVGGVEATSNSAWAARRVIGEIESRRVDLWREELDERSAAIVAAAAGRAARPFGYDLPRRPGAIVTVSARRARNAVGARRQAGVQRKTVSPATRP